VNALTRRAISLPLLFVGWAVLTSSLVVALPVALVLDALSGFRRSATRALLFLDWFLWCEVYGVLVSAALWPLLPVFGRARWFALHYRLQLGWARALWWATTRLFSLRVHVEGAGDAAPGPALVLVRHVSVADTLLPTIFVSGASGMRLRFVLKRELLWDPCLDIVGNRLPNVFVARGSGEGERERARVGDLARGLEGNDGLLIYPEGTRFSARKRKRLIERGVDGADALTHTLPPRLGGVLAALDAAPAADVVICAHTGFEGIGTMGEIFDGRLVRRDIRVRFWRVPRSEVGEDVSAWLLDQWRSVDEWVASHASVAP
jgi:1-acyl-sn-glycerol-3-phosphate acyltransferase